MAAQNHDLLWVGGAAAAAFAGYEFIYKPWKATQAANAPGLTPSGRPGSSPPVYTAPYVTSPTAIVPQPITPSNLNPGGNVGGPVGTCMSRKNWTQSQCQQRLDALVASFNWNKAKILTLQPGGSALITAQGQLAGSQAALSRALTGYNTAVAQGDAAGALQWKSQMDAQNADIAALQNSISTAPQQITAAQAAMAGAASDYQALTGLALA